MGQCEEFLFTELMAQLINRISISEIIGVKNEPPPMPLRGRGKRK
jgi:hypothetical protein